MRFIEPIQKVYAHCDIPCGIYDPHSAQIAALTVVRMMDMLADAKGAHEISRYTSVKEEHAELCKREVRIIWGDYFKGDELKNNPEISKIAHNIMLFASEARQGTDRDIGLKLLGEVNKFAEIFWGTKGVNTKRVKFPYGVEEEIVYPDL